MQVFRKLSWFVDIATCILISTFVNSLYTCVLECLLILRFLHLVCGYLKRFVGVLLCVVFNGVICMTLIVFRTALASVPLKIGDDDR